MADLPGLSEHADAIKRLAKAGREAAALGSDFLAGYEYAAGCTDRMVTAFILGPSAPWGDDDL